MKSKLFGKHVIAFRGRLNNQPLRPFVGVSADDSGENGEWLTLRQAEALANNILRAVAYLRSQAKG